MILNEGNEAQDNECLMFSLCRAMRKSSVSYREVIEGVTPYIPYIYPVYTVYIPYG